MGKTTRKPAAPRKSKFTPISHGSQTLLHFAKTRLISKTPRDVSRIPCADKIRELVDQETLTCSVCLQLLLAPVLAKCGHCFCLGCAEDLAKNGFACAICHSHDPAYDLPSSATLQTLLEDYLGRSEDQERQFYLSRKAVLQRKEQERLLGEVQEGQLVDFWSEEENSWKSGTVSEKSKTGTLSITPRRSMADLRANKKEPNQVILHESSRMLAPHHYFSKEDPQEVPEIHVRPTLQLLQRNDLNTMRMQMEERPQMFNMPMFLGYYWRGPEEILNPLQNEMFEGFQPFNF